jgi:hypothetical protein
MAKLKNQEINFIKPNTLRLNSLIPYYYNFKEVIPQTLLHHWISTYYDIYYNNGGTLYQQYKHILSSEAVLHFIQAWRLHTKGWRLNPNGIQLSLTHLNIEGVYISGVLLTPYELVKFIFIN